MYFSQNKHLWYGFSQERLVPCLFFSPTADVESQLRDTNSYHAQLHTSTRQMTSLLLQEMQCWGHVLEALWFDAQKM